MKTSKWMDGVVDRQRGLHSDETAGRTRTDGELRPRMIIKMIITMMIIIVIYDIVI